MLAKLNAVFACSQRPFDTPFIFFLCEDFTTDGKRSTSPRCFCVYHSSFSILDKVEFNCQLSSLRRLEAFLLKAKSHLSIILFAQLHAVITANHFYFTFCTAKISLITLFCTVWDKLTCSQPTRKHKCCLYIIIPNRVTRVTMQTSGTY